MATTLYLRDTTANGIGVFKDMLATAGAATVTSTVNTAASGTEVQWTQTAGGAVLEFISGRVPAGGFTLAGTMTFSIWAKESNMNANCGARARVFKRTAAGSVSEIAGGPWDDGVELGTTFAEMVWTGTPTSTAFAEDDRIIVRYYITNIGTMASGYTCSLDYNAAAGGADDSLFQITENVTFKAESTTYNESLTESATPADSQSSEATLPNTISEATTVGETMDGGLLLTGSLSEGVTAADSLADAMTWGPALSEAVATAESATTVQAFASSLAEAVTAADSLESVQAFVSSLSEVITVADSSAAELAISVTYSESVTPADSGTSAATWSNALTEAMAPAESLADSLISGGTTFNDTLAEGVSLADLLAPALTMPAAVSEAVTPADTFSAMAVFASMLSESFGAADALIAVGGADVVHVQYPLAGIAQTRPGTAPQSYPLDGTKQTYPLGSG